MTDRQESCRQVVKPKEDEHHLLSRLYRRLEKSSQPLRGVFQLLGGPQLRPASKVDDRSLDALRYRAAYSIVLIVPSDASVTAKSVIVSFVDTSSRLLYQKTAKLSFDLGSKRAVLVTRQNFSRVTSGRYPNSVNSKIANVTVPVIGRACTPEN